MPDINWRTGFFRAWVLISILWAVVWSIVVLPGAADKIALARMSDAELMSQLARNASCHPASHPPPKGFYLEDCLKRLDQDGRDVARWGGGNSSVEQWYRVVGSFAPELAFLFIPPVCLFSFRSNNWMGC
jgi:hypothetical protein